MIGSVLEVEWDDAEREWMLALEHHEATDLCQLCGMPKSICRSYEIDGMVSVTSERCHVSAAIARKRRADERGDLDLPETMAYSASIYDPTDDDPSRSHAWLTAP